MVHNMLSGSPLRVIVRFTIPLFLGSLIQQFYNIADTMIVGRTLGVNALAALGETGGVCFLVLGFFFGLTGGFAVITGQCFGAGDYEGVRRSVAISTLLSLVICILSTVVCLYTLEPLFTAMQVPEEIMADTLDYMRILYYGIAVSVFYNLLASIIRALGDSITPLIFLAVAALLNVGLDFLLILKFDMGVAGAAWATVIAQAVSGALCLGYVMLRFPILRMKRSDWRWDTGFALTHLRVGLPMAFQFSITAVGCIVVQAVLNQFGTAAVAGFTAGSRIDILAVQALAALGLTMSVYAAQNFGAGQIGRIRDGVRAANWLGVGCSVLALAFILLFGKFLVQLFIGATEPEVLKAAQEYLLLNGVFYVLLSVLFVYRNTLQGMGYALVPLLGGVAELAFRILAAGVLAKWLGYAGVCVASPAAWVGANLLLITTYYLVMRRYSAFRYRRIAGGHPGFAYVERCQALPQLP